MVDQGLTSGCCSMAAALVPNACLSVRSCTSSSASNIPSMPVADNSCVLSSSARRIPSGSDVVKPARPAPAVGKMVLLVAGFFLAPALGADLVLVGLAASSAASRASRSAFLRAVMRSASQQQRAVHMVDAPTSACLAAATSAFDSPLAAYDQFGLSYRHIQAHRRRSNLQPPWLPSP